MFIHYIHPTKQCDQMTRLFFQYLAIYKQWKFAQKHKKCAKVGLKLFPIPKKHLNIPKDLEIFAKAVESR